MIKHLRKGFDTNPPPVGSVSYSAADSASFENNPRYSSKSSFLSVFYLLYIWHMEIDILSTLVLLCSGDGFGSCHIKSCDLSSLLNTHTLIEDSVL